MRTTILIFVITVLSFANVFAQSSPGDIVTDRPDQTESPDLVPPGYVQVESGVSFEKYTDQDNQNWEQDQTYFSTLIRIGVFKNLEVRIAPEYANITHKYRSQQNNPWNEQNFSGFNPLVLGTKIFILNESSNLPAMSFLFHVDLPEVASSDFKGGYPTPEIRLAVAKELSDRFSLGVNLGAEFDMAYRSTNGLYTIALGTGITDKLSGFIEFYGFFRERFDNIHFFDGGFTYLLQKNLQIDVSGGVGLTDLTHDYFINGGISVRLPR